MFLNGKGDRRERELVNAFDEAGLVVVRAPASGSATTHELPDVLAGNGEVLYAIRAKALSGHPTYLSGKGVKALVYFSRNFGARARVAVRFDCGDWCFLHLGDLYVTDGGSYRIRKGTALAEGKDFGSFTGGPTQIRLGGD